MLKKAIYYFFVFPYYKWKLGGIGRRSWLVHSKVQGHKRIWIGQNVYINDQTWLACLPFENHQAALRIGDGSYIGRFCHFYATSRIEIGKKVLIADKVYLADNQHGFKDITIPVIDQPVTQTAPVIIDDGAWLGENVCVIGARVGKQSVVGANSVVLKDIPDYCIAAGAPARIIRRYSFEKKEWLRTDENGAFLI